MVHVVLSEFEWYNSFFCLHANIFQFVLWYLLWLKRYKIEGKPYTWNDAEYLTRGALGLDSEKWKNLG